MVFLPADRTLTNRTRAGRLAARRTKPPLVPAGCAFAANKAVTCRIIRTTGSSPSIPAGERKKLFPDEGMSEREWLRREGRRDEGRRGDDRGRNRELTANERLHIKFPLTRSVPGRPAPNPRRFFLRRGVELHETLPFVCRSSAVFIFSLISSSPTAPATACPAPTTGPGVFKTIDTRLLAWKSFPRVSARLASGGAML